MKIEMNPHEFIALLVLVAILAWMYMDYKSKGMNQNVVMYRDSAGRLVPYSSGLEGL